MDVEKRVRLIHLRSTKAGEHVRMVHDFVHAAWMEDRKHVVCLVHLVIMEGEEHARDIHAACTRGHSASLKNPQVASNRFPTCRPF